MQQEPEQGARGTHSGRVLPAEVTGPSSQPGCLAGTWVAQTGIAGGFKSVPAFHNLSLQLPMQDPYTFVYHTSPSLPAVLLTHNIHVYLKAG